MSVDEQQPSLAEIQRALAEDPEALAWQVRSAAAQRAARGGTGGADAEAAVRLLEILTGDPKWEVRKAVADALLVLDDATFVRLAARLLADANRFVKVATQRSLDRRRTGERLTVERRQDMARVEDLLQQVGAAHGPAAAQAARRAAFALVDQFVGSMVHDMRGIMSPLRRSAKLIGSAVDEPTVDAGTMKVQAHRMLDRVHYLEHLLDDMQGYAQPVPAERHPERVADLVREAQEQVREWFLAKGLDVSGITFEAHIDQSLWVRVARRHLVTALINLLRNANDAFLVDIDRYGAGAVRIEAIAVGAQAQIVIHDTGMGLSADDLAAIRRFIPGGSSKKGSRGTGFGLPTAHRRIFEHGGNLAITSESGRGTTITIHLPRAEDDQS